MSKVLTRQGAGPAPGSVNGYTKLYYPLAGEKDDDFIGFYFNGKYSGDLGIYRTSDGSRYNEDLLPTLQDKTVQVPGGDGTYYFGSYYTQRNFQIPYAFDKLTETQFRELRKFLGQRVFGPLIFEERPYKYYTAKISTTNSDIKYICFEDDSGARVYKGEGTLNFVCYNPFAKSIYRFLNNFSSPNPVTEKKFFGKSNHTYTNINQWKDSSGMKQLDQYIDDHISITDGQAMLYTDNLAFFDDTDSTLNTGTTYRGKAVKICTTNVGDKEAPFKLKIDLGNINNDLPNNESPDQGLDLFISTSELKSDLSSGNPETGMEALEKLYQALFGEGDQITPTSLNDILTDMIENVAKGVLTFIIATYVASLYDNKYISAHFSYDDIQQRSGREENILVIDSMANSIYFEDEPSVLFTGILKQGDFFNLPVGKTVIEITTTLTVIKNAELDYSFLYF